MALMFSSMGCKAYCQPNSCGDFTLVNIATDSINQNTLQISIHYGATSSSFVNYPYISALIDCQGDTVATGNMFWFGQMGQSTIDYPVNTNSGMPCLPLTAVFIYGDNSMVNDTCQLSFSGTNSLENSEIIEVKMYPNPTQDLVWIEVPVKALGERLEWRDITGKLIFTTILSDVYDCINVAHLPRGSYFIQYGDPSTGAGCAVVPLKMVIQ